MSNIIVPKLSILSEEQVYGENKLKIFDLIRTEASLTDTAIIRGAMVSGCHLDGNDDNLKSRTGYYYLKDTDGYGDVSIVDNKGGYGGIYCDSRNGGIRLTIPYSLVKHLVLNITEGLDGLLRVEYGGYSENALDIFEQATLNDFYDNKKLDELSQGCVFDSRKHDEYNDGFLLESQTYYEHNKEIKARIRVNSSYSKVLLSNNMEYGNKDYVWTRVKPVIWLKHPDEDLMVSEKLISSGVRFYNQSSGYDGNFDKTELKWYLDNFLSREIFMINELMLNADKNDEDDYKETINNFIFYKDGMQKKVRIIVKTKNRKTL